jgi:hypothetical protein
MPMDVLDGCMKIISDRILPETTVAIVNSTALHYIITMRKNPRFWAAALRDQLGPTKPVSGVRRLHTIVYYSTHFVPIHVDVDARRITSENTLHHPNLRVPAMLKQQLCQLMMWAWPSDKQFVFAELSTAPQQTHASNDCGPMSLAIVDRRAHGMPIETLRHVWNTAHVRAVMFTLLEQTMEHLPGGILTDVRRASSSLPPASTVSVELQSPPAAAQLRESTIMELDTSSDNDYKEFQSDQRQFERLHERQLQCIWEQHLPQDEIEHCVELFLCHMLEVVVPTDTEPAKFRNI